MRESNHRKEAQKFNVTVSFHRIQLALKFTCQISLSLKIPRRNPAFIDIEPRPLVNGNCQLAQDITTEIECRYDAVRKEYSQSMIEAIVLVHSAKGIIQGGSAFIDPTKTIDKEGISLKKCSDRSAKLVISCLSQKIKEKQLSPVKRNPISGISSCQVSQYNSRRASKEKTDKIARIKSQQPVSMSSFGDQSPISISKVSVTSNSRLQKYLRTQNQQLQNENDQLRQKIKVYERKQKEMFNELKQVTMKLQKETGRCIQFQGLNELNEMLLIEKDKCISTYEEENAKLDQDLSNYCQQIKLLEKKLYMKEEDSQNQSLRYIEKIDNLHKQLEKATTNHLALLLKYQQSESAMLDNLKDKERAHLQQKNTLKDEISLLQTMVSKMRQENDNNNQRTIIEASSTNGQQKIRSELSALVEQQKQRIEELNFSLICLQKAKQDLEDELKETRKREEDRLSLKRKVNELAQENQRIRMQHERAMQSLNLSDSKISEVIDQLDWLQAQRKRLEEHLVLKQLEIKEKDKQLRSITKEKDQLYNDIQQQQTAYEEELRYQKQSLETIKSEVILLTQQLDSKRLLNSRLQSEIDQLKQQRQLLRKELKQVNALLAQQKNKNQSLKKELLQKQGQNQVKDSKIAQLQRLVIEIQIERDTNSIKIKSLTEELKQVTDLMNVEQKKSLLSNLSKVQEFEQMQQTLRHLASTNQDFIAEIQNLKNQISELQLTVAKNSSTENVKNKENQRLRDELSMRQEQIYRLKEENGQLKQEADEADYKMEMMKKSIADLQRSEGDSKAKVHRLEKQIADLGQYSSSLQRQMQDYRAHVELCFQEIIKVLYSQEVGVHISLQDLSESLQKSLDRALHQRRQWLSSLYRGYDNVKEEKEFIEFELMRIGQELIDCQAELQEKIQKQKQEKAFLRSQWAQQQKNLLQEIQSLRISAAELKASNQAYFRQDKQYQHQIQDLEKENASLTSQILQLEAKLKEQEREVVQLTQLYQGLLRTTKLQQQSSDQQSYALEKQRLLIDIETMKKIAAKRDQELVIANERSKSLQQRLLSVQIDNKKLSFDLSVQTHLMQQLQQKYAMMSALKSQQDELLRDLGFQLQQKQKKVSQKQIDLQQHSVKYCELQEKIKDLLEQKKSLWQSIAQLKEQLSQKGQQIKEIQFVMNDRESQHRRIVVLLEQEKTKVERELSIYRLMVDQAQGVIENLQKSKYELEIQCESRNTRIQSLKEILAKAKEDLFQQSDKRLAIVLDNQSIKINIKQLQEEVTFLQSQNRELKEQALLLAQSITLKDRQSSQTAEDMVYHYSKNIDLLQKELERKDIRLKELTNSYSELRDKLLQATLLQQHKQREIQGYMHDRQRTLASHTEELNKLEQTLEVLRCRNNQLMIKHSQETQALSRRVESLQQQLIQIDLNQKKRLTEGKELNNDLTQISSHLS